MARCSQEVSAVSTKKRRPRAAPAVVAPANPDLEASGDDVPRWESLKRLAEEKARIEARYDRGLDRIFTKPKRRQFDEIRAAYRTAIERLRERGSDEAATERLRTRHEAKLHAFFAAAKIDENRLIRLRKRDTGALQDAFDKAQRTWPPLPR